MTSYICLTEWLVEMRNRELRQRALEFRKEKRHFRQKHAATMAAIEILREVLSRFEDKSFDIEDSRKRLFATGLSKKELVALFDRSTTPRTRAEREKHAKDEAALAAKEQDLKVRERKSKRTGQHLKDAAVVLEAMQNLFHAAGKFDDEDAARELHDAAQTACAFLGFLSKSKPELIRPRDRISQMWPILIEATPNSHKQAAAVMEHLQLGADTIYGRLRKERAFRETTPSRNYARVLVETIWINRLLIPELSERLHAMQIMDPDFTTDFEELPQWFKLIAPLPPFSTSSVAQWGAAAREVLRCECPDFHLRTEWSSVRAAFQPHEKGRTQNKILDKILSAMRTIARSKESESSTKK